MAPSTSPALAQETVCSALRPPNTTAIRTLRADPMLHLRLSSQPEDASRWPARKNYLGVSSPMRKVAVPGRYRCGRFRTVPCSTFIRQPIRRARLAVPVEAAPAQALQGHEGVADQVLGVFEADGEAHRARVDARGGQGPV